MLGSQTDQLDGLPNSVQFSIRQPERRIEMGQLSREAVRHIVERAGISEFLSREDAERVYNLSGGHPLALIYILRQLETITEAEAVKIALQNIPPYDGNIEEQYHGYWRQLDEDDELATLMGLIARIRNVIDLRWIESWSQGAVVRRLRRKFAHLFRIEDNDRWYFFHNSFRLYVSHRTGQSIPGSFDPARDRDLHYELAIKCRESSDTRWQWEELYHLYNAEADDDLLERARPELFRGQFLEFRSAEAIRSDIVLAIKTAGRQRDVVTLVRLLFCDAEMGQREANTEGLSLAPLLLTLQDAQAAIDRLRDGQRLRVPATRALEDSTEFLALGMEREAQQLFDLGEPLEYLSGSKEMARHGDHEDRSLLNEWAAAAVQFRPVDKVIAAILRVRIEPDRFARQAEVAEDRTISVTKVEVDRGAAKAEADEESISLQNILLFRAGVSLVEKRRWTELIEVERALLDRGVAGENRWFTLRAHSWRTAQADGDLVRAREFLNETIERGNVRPPSNAIYVDIAEGILRLAEDTEQARVWMEKARPIAFQEIPTSNFGFHIFHHLFRYARLLYTLGDRRRPAEIIQEPPEARKMGAVYFQRGVCTVARIWASAWRKLILDHATLRQETFPLLRLFYHDWRSSKWDSWYWLTKLKGAFYELLISAVALHGKEALQALAEDFIKEWEAERRYWSGEDIREIVLAFHSAGMSEAWSSEQLERVERRIVDHELLERVGERVEQARARLQLGEYERSRESLVQALIDSSSVGSKDYQLGEWIGWMRRANRLDPGQAVQRVGWFAHAIVDLERNGGPANAAAYDLLEAAFEWSPRRAGTLFRWFFDQGLINFDDAVRRLLRGALSSSSPPTTFIAVILQHFLLPVCDVDRTLITQLIARLYEQAGKEGVIEFALGFVSEVEVHSLQPNRRGWRRSLARSLRDKGIMMSDAGLTEADLTWESDRGSDSNLSLKDGSSLTASQVRERAATLAGFRELMRLDSGSYFYWDDIVDDLALTLTDPSEVMEVVGFFTSERRSARIMGRLAERLLALGDFENAKQSAQHTLSMSERTGWAVQLSGGIKILSYKVLTTIDGERARETAFSDFVADMTGPLRYPGLAVQHLEEIIPLLVAQVPEREVWAEVDQYVHSLFPGVDAALVGSQLMSSLSEELTDDTPIRALSDLLTLHIPHPINVLANSAQMVFIKLLQKGDSTTKDAMRTLLRSGERSQESALMILDAVTSRNGDVAVDFAEDLGGLASSPNIALRLVAKRIAQRIDISLQIGSEGAPANASIYGLSLPPGPSVSEVWRENIREPQEFLPDTNDPYELLKIQLIELEWAASHAGIPTENIVQRGARIAHLLTQEDEWAILGEEILRNRFDRAGLKYSYRRPRATIARRAFFHVVAELVDAGMLSEESLEVMKPAFNYYDPEMFFIKPSTRPEFAFPTTEEGRRDADGLPSDPDSNWLPRLKTANGLLIMGEFTKTKTLEWKTPEVIRQSQIGTRSPERAADEHSFFYRKMFCLIQDYPSLRVGSSLQPLVIWHDGGMLDSPNPEWLAFNPELARALGWTTARDLLLGWVDESERPMVWSVIWEDGLYETQPPKFRTDVSKGWAVVATPEAVKLMEAQLLKPLTQYIRVEISSIKEEQTKSDVRQTERLVI